MEKLFGLEQDPRNNMEVTPDENPYTELEKQRTRQESFDNTLGTQEDIQRVEDKIKDNRLKELQKISMEHEDKYNEAYQKKVLAQEKITALTKEADALRWKINAREAGSAVDKAIQKISNLLSGGADTREHYSNVEKYKEIKKKLQELADIMNKHDKDFHYHNNKVGELIGKQQEIKYGSVKSEKPQTKDNDDPDNRSLAA
jgi:hypothetical protein